MKKKVPEKKKKLTRGKLLLWLWLLLVSPIVLFSLLMYLISLGVFGALPSFEQLENPKNSLATEIYTADGKLLGKYFSENRSQMDFEEISPHVINALVSTEDERFYEHSGIDARGLFRAVVFMGTKGGASTITQQLAKMLFSERPRTKIERINQKLQEWIIAIGLERQYTKNEILTMYLNRFDFVNNAVGLKSAAQVYFNTTPDSLSINEAAVLVGMAKNPSLFNPNRRLELSTKRRNVVLGQMVRNEVITSELRDSLVQLPLVLDFQKVDHKDGAAPYFREALRSHLHKLTKAKDKDGNYKLAKPNGEPYNIYHDGLRIYTTIDSRLQKYAEYGVTQHLKAELQKDFWKHINNNKNPPFANGISDKTIERLMNGAIKRTDLYRELRNEGMTEDSIMHVFNTPVPTKVFSWSGEIDTVLSPKQKLRYHKSFLHAGLMSVNPHNGYIKAWVGGINKKYFAYDHVYQGRRQIGSTIKPFVYALAITDIGMSPCDMVPNVPHTFEKGMYGLLKPWTPHNPGRDYGYDVSLKYGLANSLNTITAYVMKQVSPQAVINFVRKAGIKGEMDAVPSLCLGVADMALAEMVGAYASFANKGQYLEPVFMTRIMDKNGNEIYNNLVERKTNSVLSERDAYLMLELMKGTTVGVRSSHDGRKIGTAVRLRLPKTVRPYGGIPYSIPIAGKTGTTQNQSDGWFIGITPDLVTGVWVGAEDRAIRFRYLNKGMGTNMALPIWGYYMNKVYDDESLDISKGDFEKPLEPMDINLDCDKEIPTGKDYYDRDTPTDWN